ncbi:SMP-30/gluconolactonase/LRE family protein [Catenulispora subtropica]|uniref:SMP-30/gluconolactonase/LRE family protein n=1 Tax=Catenulispora subtropica TaxID=450798 RepID=A0ABP5D5K6_9ACTN
MAQRTKMSAVRWTPPANPQPVRPRGDVRTLPELRRIELPGAGPEHIAVDAWGTLFTGLADGRIVRVTPEGEVRTVTNTGGRPLGMELHGNDRLLVCDALRGLLEVQLAKGTVAVLAAKVDDEPLIFCSNVAVGADDVVYFTQSSRRYNLDEYRGDLLEHSSTGRLLRLRDGVVETVADGFAFANGLVLVDDDDGAAAIVAETGGYCLTRVALNGPGAGAKTPFGAPLAGFPDNLTHDARGLIWVALPNPRDPLLDWLLPRNPRLRHAVWATPEKLQPGEKDLSWMVAVDDSGTVVRELRGWDVDYRMVTCVRRRGNTLYLGSLTERAIAVVELDTEA